MFYGASTIPNDGKSAVGCVLSTATKYVKCHGPGAIIFLYGYGEQLAKQLLQLGVIPLDCSYHYNYCTKNFANKNSKNSSNASTSNCNNNIRNMIDIIDLSDVIEHQKKWCANKAGVVLP
jgi:hypothetical protein